MTHARDRQRRAHLGSLCSAGPRTLEEANGHRADENLKLDDLSRATEVVALSLADMLRSS